MFSTVVSKHVSHTATEKEGEETVHASHDTQMLTRIKARHEVGGWYKEGCRQSVVKFVSITCQRSANEIKKERRHSIGITHLA